VCQLYQMLGLVCVTTVRHEPENSYQLQLGASALHKCADKRWKMHIRLCADVVSHCASACVLRGVWLSSSPYMGEHVGIFSPCLGKAKVAQLEHWGVTVVQQGVVQLEIPVYICMLRMSWM